MKRLVFKEILILSKVEKRARRIKLSPKANIVIGENDVGKSTLIKSIYHALGADTPKLGNSKWKLANPIYLLKFSVADVEYSILRDEKYFGLFDAEGKLIGKYVGITVEGGVSEAINPLLNFDVELESTDEVLKKLGPSYYFLPFYVDQDDGWSKSWASFVGLQGIKNYREKMLDYHLGIRPQSYYDAQKESFLLNEEREALENQKNSFIEVRDNFKKRKIEQMVDIDPVAFKAEIEELVLSYNQIQEKQQSQLSLVKKARNDKLSIENEIDILRKGVRELEADYKYCESPDTPDVIDCPTCGTEFKNSIKERFGILDDIDYCYALIDQRLKDLINIQEKIVAINNEYDLISKQVSSISEILNRKRSDVSFHEMVTAEGYKEILKSLGDDITLIDTKQVDLDSRIIDLKQNKLKLDVELKKQITIFYQGKMKEALNKLNVQVLSENDYGSIHKTIGANTLGSDLPRALLAQYISLLHTMYQYNKFVLCPLVIDSPLQQEQDPSNGTAIFNFIFSSSLPDQQLILGTISVNDKLGNNKIPEDCNVIILDTKFGLLLEHEYNDVLAEVMPMQNATLSTI